MTHTLILLAIGNLMLLLAIRSLRAQRLKVRHALLFLFVGLPFFGLAAWPDAVGYVGALLGVEYQTVMLLIVTTFFLVMNFKLLSIVSNQDRRIICLAQMVATLTQKQPGAKSKGRSVDAPLTLKRSAEIASRITRRSA